MTRSVLARPGFSRQRSRKYVRTVLNHDQDFGRASIVPASVAPVALLILVFFERKSRGGRTSRQGSNDEINTAGDRLSPRRNGEESLINFI